VSQDAPMAALASGVRAVLVRGEHATTPDPCTWHSACSARGMRSLLGSIDTRGNRTCALRTRRCIGLLAAGTIICFAAIACGDTGSTPREQGGAMLTPGDAPPSPAPSSTADLPIDLGSCEGSHANDNPYCPADGCLDPPTAVCLLGRWRCGLPPHCSLCARVAPPDCPCGTASCDERVGAWSCASTCDAGDRGDAGDAG
jgi:hypothetical protein